MSASTIIDTAPLGALIRYTDGSPKPPARFTKKLAAWERSNGVGRLVKKEPPRAYPTWTAPASFTLHEGNFSSDGVILVTIMRSHSADSLLIFEVAEEPKPGLIRITLRYRPDGTSVLHGLRRVSKPSLRVYVGHDCIRPVRSGLGVSILSTPRGVMTGKTAQRSKAGGEVICEVW